MWRVAKYLSTVLLSQLSSHEPHHGTITVLTWSNRKIYMYSLVRNCYYVCVCDCDCRLHYSLIQSQGMMRYTRGSALNTLTHQLINAQIMSTPNIFNGKHKHCLSVLVPHQYPCQWLASGWRGRVSFFCSAGPLRWWKPAATRPNSLSGFLASHSIFHLSLPSWLSLVLLLHPWCLSLLPPRPLRQSYRATPAGTTDLPGACHRIKKLVLTNIYHFPARCYYYPPPPPPLPPYLYQPNPHQSHHAPPTTLPFSIHIRVITITYLGTAITKESTPFLWKTSRSLSSRVLTSLSPHSPERITWGGIYCINAGVSGYEWEEGVQNVYSTPNEGSRRWST